MITLRRAHRIINLVLVVALVTTLLPVQLWAPPFATSVAAQASDPVAQPQPPDANPDALTPTQPAALAHPLALSRVQSSYASGGETVVTFTVTNNQLPTLAPEIDDTTTVTDTVAILAGFVLTDDMNTLRNVELEMTLTNGTLVDGNGAAQSGSTLTWVLPDIAPQQSEQVTVTLSSTASGGSFVELDDGALVSAELWDQLVSAQARPAVVIPDTVDSQFMTTTVDADVYDADMLWQSAEFQQDPLTAFDTVQSYTYDPYKGSLRGTRGTLWGEAGNSLDQSSLLIAMLRAAGVPARYRHGTLPVADAQTLIASMFPDAQGVAGVVPAGEPVGDPVNDPDLIDLVQDHWWVEAYLPGSGWTDLDPSFPIASVGDSFAVPGVNDRIAAVPAAEQHKLHLALRVEQYTAFPATGDFLATQVPLTATIPTAEVAGKRLVYSQLVSEELLGGLTFVARQITYLPYFAIEENDQAYLGDEFADLLSNFPFTTRATVAAWLEYTIEDVDGNTETFERVVKDLVGPEARVNGGGADLQFGSDSVQFFFPSEQFVHWVLPNDVPEWAYARQAAAGMPAAITLMEQTQGIVDMLDELSDGLTVNEYDLLLDTTNAQVEAQVTILSLMGLEFANSADTAIQTIADGLRSKMYYATPRIFTIGSQIPVVGAASGTNVDLRTTRSELIVAPGQAEEAKRTAQWLKGIVESELEGDVLENLFGEPPLTTSRLFAEMEALGIDPVKLTPTDLDLLDLYPYSDEAKLHMRAALLEGKTIVAPAAHVEYNGQPELAWWEIDPDTGETISVGENGLHPSLVFYVLVKAIVESLVDAVLEFIINTVLVSLTGGLVGIGPGGGGGLGPGLAGWIEQLAFMGQSLSDLFFRIGEVINGALSAPLAPNLTSWIFLPSHVCPVDACGVEQFLLDGIADQPVPLPGNAFVYRQLDGTDERTGRGVAVTDNGAGGASIATLTANPATSTIAVTGSAVFDADISANFDDTFDLYAYVPSGWSLLLNPVGQVTATPQTGVEAGEYAVMVVAQARSDRSLVVSAEHTITVTAAEALGFSVSAEPNITIPQNDALFADASGQTNDGEAEIPDSAYRVDIHNQSPTTKTFAVNATGAPAGWIILDGAEQTSTSVTLPPGGKTTLGLYIVPTALPAPGTSYTIDVTISDGGSLSDSAQIIWTMPGQAHNFITVQPDTVYVGANDTVTVSLGMENVGNVAGVFPVTATTPISTWLISPIGDFSLTVGEDDAQTVSITTANGEIGRTYPVQFASPAPGSYTQYAFADVVIVSPDAEQLALGADEVAACSAEPDLAAAFDAIFNTFSVLESACTSGACDSQQRDAVVDGVTLLVDALNQRYPALDTSAAEAAAATLAVADTVQTNLDALPAVSSSVADLVEPLCAIAGSQPALQWTPAYDAALVGETITYTLDLTNQGTTTSTYALTATLPGGPFNDTPTVNPGATISYDFPLSSGTPALLQLDAEVVADATSLSNDDASAALNVVDRFIQLTAVTVDPDFVETGTSQTDVSVTVANLANIPISADAVVTVRNEGGGVLFSAETPLLIRPGNPQSTDLLTLDTSGYAEGVYTVEVEIVDAADVPIDAGSGTALLGVGQALGTGHTVSAELVPPGTVTVTTVITTGILVGTAVTNEPEPAAPLWPATGQRPSEQVSMATGQLPADDEPQSVDDSTFLGSTSVLTDDAALAVDNLPLTINRAPAGYTRTEASDTAAITYSGSWTSWSRTPTSDGNLYYSNTPGDSASFGFSGTWVNIGLHTRFDGGAAEIFINGASQGVFDLYSNEPMMRDFVFSGLSAGTHTISVTVAASTNPNTQGDYVYLDYFDTWDGTPIPNGTLEQDSTDFLYSTGWSTTVNGGTNASGGTYARSTNGAVWLPFEGDSISIDAYRDFNAGPSDFYIDGQFVARVDLYNALTSANPITETISFSGLGAGLHLLTIHQHQNRVQLDRVTTPAISADYTPPAQTGIARIEEFDPAIRYDGVPFTATITDWDYDPAGVASRGDTAFVDIVGSSVSLDFDSDWVAVGLQGTGFGGMVEVTIDGVVLETVDTYRRVAEPITRIYDGLGAGPHTITVTLLADVNPLSGRTWLFFDYFDTWDGTAEPTGIYEADFIDLDRIRYSDGWSLRSDPDAGNGDYVRSNSGSLWFHFTGDSVTYEAFAYPFGDIAEVWIDGERQTVLDVGSNVDISRTVTFDSFGAGPHVMLVRAPRDIASVDRFHVPAIEPATDLDCTGYCRHEEFDAALRFNGLPLNQAPDDFFFGADQAASTGYYIENRIPGDNVSLTFDGEAVAVGFFGWYRGGLIDVAIDGTLIETVDTYRTDPTMFTRYYPVASGTHTISLTVTGNQNPNADRAWLRLDYIDTWDGTTLLTGMQEVEEAGWFSNSWAELSDAVASNGTYWRSPGEVSYNQRLGNFWVPFEGDSVQFDAIARSGGNPFTRVLVDGVEQPLVNLWSGEAEIRTFAFDGFGPGAHLLQIEGQRDQIALDTVTTPATQSAHTNPTPTGFIRYEEIDLTYDGDAWEQRSTDWVRQIDSANTIIGSGYSDWQAVRTNDVGRSVSLTFTGSWVNVGFEQYNQGGSAEIYIDGVLQRTVNLNGSATLTETQFTVITGTHTISITAVGDGQVTLDYIDVYDGTPVSDGEIDAWVGDVDGDDRVHFSNSFTGNLDTNAINDGYLSGGQSVWYTFLGDSVTFYGFATDFTRNADVYIDGQFVETISFEYDFTPIPLAFHYSGLGDGPHTIRVDRGNELRVDGFASPATNTPYLPQVEWNGPEARGNALNCGMCSGITAGDINGDGVVELVFGSATSFGNRLFVYRGDGADTGDGDAVIWSDAWSSGDISTPALGELDPTYPGIEIVVISNGGMRVYHADGTLWWEDTSIEMYDYIGSPALGNLDADPEPEIVVNAKEDLIVLDADGTVLWSVTKDTRVGMPLLADMTGDGLLDIVVSESGKDTFPTRPPYTYLYDYNLGSPNLVWTTTYTTSMVDLFGSHAIADIDGLQPGGDDGPEIAVSRNGFLTVLDADGSVLWDTELEPGAPGGVSIADLDGDGEVEILTGMKHEFEPGRFGKLYAVNADGTLLWDIQAEDSTSANSAGVLDLNGDGIYEVAWTGLQQGFNIFNGLDGSTLFNDPAIFTRSGTDHPIIVDVDGDDSAEIVIATQTSGVVVLGFDGFWGEARSIWNQHTYHITNVNDDLTIPASEPNSWDSHNTYKTQFPDEFVLPIFGVTVSHTVGTDDLVVDSFNVPPDVSADPLYRWDYVQTVSSPTVTRTLDVVLSNLTPGETRQVAQGTVVSYTLGSGQNTLTLPPLYVTVAKLIALEPFSQTVGAGGTATYTVTLSNPTDTAASYALAVAGLGGLATLPSSVNVPANSSVDVPLIVDTPTDLSGAFEFVVTVDGGIDSAAGQLVVVDGLDMALVPGLQSAEPGQTRSYTLTVSNLLPDAQDVALSVTGLPDVTAPPSVNVPGNGSVDVAVTARGFVGGQLPFTVEGTTGDGAGDSASAILDVSATQEVALTLNPDPAVGGPGATSEITVTVTNTGGTVETFDLAVAVPAGWQATLAQNEITLTPFVFNSAEIQLLVTPPPGTVAASYPISVTAAAQTAGLAPAQPATTTVVGAVDVGADGVDIAIDPANRTLLPSDAASWTITVTNTGNVQNTFVITASGIAALAGELSQDTVTLNAGASTTVQLSADAFSFALPGEYAFAVAATDADNAAVADEVKATVTFETKEAVEVSWYPTTQTVEFGESAYYMLTITNTGNLLTEYDLSVVPLAGTVNLTVTNDVLPIPARAAVQVLVEATAYLGTYDLSGSAESDAGTLGVAQAELIVETPTAVTLAAFDAAAEPDGSVLVTWVTAAEIDNAGFNLYRSATPTFDPGTATQLNAELIAAQAQFGQGATYQFADADVASGVWYYFLEDVELSGLTALHGPVEVDTVAPTSAGLFGFGGGGAAVSAPLTLILAALVLLFATWRRLRRAG